MDKANNEDIVKFLRSYDFMRLGQSINKQQWQAAAMCVQRMSKYSKELGLDNLERNLTGLRQSINRKNQLDAKQNLAMVINKRVQLLNNIFKDK